MRIVNKKIVFSPSDMSTFFKSPFAAWMERYCFEKPHEKFEIEEDPTMKLLAHKGNEFETSYFSELKKKYKKVIEIKRSKDFAESLQGTISAMKSGADIIYQAALGHEEFAGYADFLKKIDTPSKLGNYSYEIVDTKLAHSTKPEYILQLSCYTEMVAQIQGLIPTKFHVVLGNGEEESFKVDDFSAYYRHFKRRFLKFHNEFDSTKIPDPEPWEDLGDWEDHGNEILKAKDHLMQVAGIGISQIKKLEQVGIKTMSALAKAKKSDRPKGMQEDTFDRLIKQATLQKATEKIGKTQFELREIDTDQIYGLQRLPPSDPNDVYFDMEGYPLAEGGLEYLFGASFEEKGKLQFKDWWALNKKSEKSAFEEWIDWVYKRFRANPNMHIYHYAPYETTAMKKLMGEHMTREHEVDELLRNGVFVDLYQIVREGLIVGEPSYSIKKLEGLYGFKRKGDVKTAGDSVVQFANWLQLQDGKDWKTSKILREIRDYNEEDCVSTLELTAWLRAEQKKEKIKYQASVENLEPADETERSEADALLQQMTIKVPKGESESMIHEILSAALGYHRREAKPQWWSYFQRQGSLPEELVEDFDCLAQCKVTARTASSVTVSFDPYQETKMNIDSKFVLHNARGSGLIESIDFEQGRAVLSVGGKAEVAEEITLLPSTPISTKPIETSIFETTVDWHSHHDPKKMRPALMTLLTRAEPKIRGRKKGEAIIGDEASDVVPQVILAVENLNESILAIQGPPGTGKTYTASHVIASLVVKGYKVGVTSNGHKAINLLLKKSYEVLKESKKDAKIKIAKIRSESEEELEREAKVLHFSSAKDFWKKGSDSNLVGGTSWFFSAADSKDKFEYLFIEEAGQFSLANAIATQRSARNIVLLGDQMQLEQPVQGTHPECIAHSVLNFYLDGHDTVPPHMGAFLGVSRRMRPEVCDFISSTFYEGRLKSDKTTLKNLVHFTQSTKLPTDKGLLFVPIEHEGNSQGSEEEVDLIKKLVSSLKNAKVVEYSRSNPEKVDEHTFSMKDVLLVAPYNLQVGLLQTALGGDAKVGTVDLFQGQEAPIVIFSMCSSNGEASPRGLDFILNRHRLNVAISRAKTLAVVIGSPKIAETRVTSIMNMALLNLFCRILERSL